MWNDTETTEDFLNFKVIADAVAKMVIEFEKQPISIGVSGDWGAGKSSLVKMIGESLEASSNNKEYLFVNFNAWLYQGYDDARMALLQTVADKILKRVGETNSSLSSKAKELVKRINWLKLISLSSKTALAYAAGIGPLMTAASMAAAAADSLGSSKQKLLEPKEEKSIPEEISAFRNLFQGLLKDLKLTLVVLVDDLDRCLPDTAISTLEAMRLLLYMPNTAFIIAADQQMIQNAISAHFNSIALDNKLVTSYFDKLIQVPLRVPRLGVNEVRAYLILLLADRAQRLGKINPEEKNLAYRKITEILKKSWEASLTKKMMINAYGEASKNLITEIDTADQTAEIFTNDPNIQGNPRIIKRFLNNLVLQEEIAKSQGMEVSFDQIIKVLLFERCADAKSFDHLVKLVGNAPDGKLEILKELENSPEPRTALLENEKEWANDDFVSAWLNLKPKLENVDLRPLLFLSRNKVIGFPDIDELSSEANNTLSLLLESNSPVSLASKIKQLRPKEAVIVFERLEKKIIEKKYDIKLIKAVLFLPKIHPNVQDLLEKFLHHLQPEKRHVALIPLLEQEAWAKKILKQWSSDTNTPPITTKAIFLIQSANQ